MRTCLILSTLVVLALAVPALADDPKPAKEVAVPEALKDPDFDKYLDMKKLREALADSNPAALADVALKLAEGEAALSRKHKGLSAGKLFDLAARTAKASGDKATMERLTKAAEQMKRKDFNESLENIALVGSAGRTGGPAAGINLDSYPAEKVVLFNSFVDQIKAAKNLSSKAQIDDLEKQIRGTSDFPDALKSALGKYIAEVRRDLPPAEPDSEMDVLAKLATATRAAKSFTEAKVQIKNSTTEPVTFTLSGTLQPKTLKAGQVGSYSVRLEGYWTPQTPESEKVPYAVQNKVKTLLYGSGTKAGKVHTGKYEFVGDPKMPMLKESES